MTSSEPYNLPKIKKWKFCTPYSEREQCPTIIRLARDQENSSEEVISRRDIPGCLCATTKHKCRLCGSGTCSLCYPDQEGWDKVCRECSQSEQNYSPPQNEQLDYEKLKVDQLRNLCKERKLPTSGNKTKLQGRLLGGAKAKTSATLNKSKTKSKDVPSFFLENYFLSNEETPLKKKRSPDCTAEENEFTDMFSNEDFDLVNNERQSPLSTKFSPENETDFEEVQPIGGLSSDLFDKLPIEDTHTKSSSESRIKICNREINNNNSDEIRDSMQKTIEKLHQTMDQQQTTISHLQRTTEHQQTTIESLQRIIDQQQQKIKNLESSPSNIVINDGEFNHEIEITSQEVEMTSPEVEITSQQTDHSNNLCCLSCDKLFTEARYLKRHIERYHIDEKKCQVCGKIYPSRLSHALEKHMLTHTGIICDHCGSKFKSFRSRRRHMINYCKMRVLSTHTAVTTDNGTSGNMTKNLGTHEAVNGKSLTTDADTSGNLTENPGSQVVSTELSTIEKLVITAVKVIKGRKSRPTTERILKWISKNCPRSEAEDILAALEDLSSKNVLSKDVHKGGISYKMSSREMGAVVSDGGESSSLSSSRNQHHPESRDPNLASNHQRDCRQFQNELSDESRSQSYNPITSLGEEQSEVSGQVEQSEVSGQVEQSEVYGTVEQSEVLGGTVKQSEVSSTEDQSELSDTVQQTRASPIQVKHGAVDLAKEMECAQRDVEELRQPLNKDIAMLLVSDSTSSLTDWCTGFNGIEMSQIEFSSF